MFVSSVGTLTDRFGLPVMGQALDGSGQAASRVIDVSFVNLVPWRPTTQVALTGNRSSSAALGMLDPTTVDTALHSTAFETTVTIYGNSRRRLDILVLFTHSAPMTWDVAAAVAADDGGLASALIVLGTSTLSFDASGLLSMSAVVPLYGVAQGNFVDALLTLDVTQFALPSGTVSVTQDGEPGGGAPTLTIDARGILRAEFPGGATVPLYQLAVARFPAPALPRKPGGRGAGASPTSDKGTSINFSGLS